MGYTDTSAGQSSGRGIFDCDGAHRTPLKADYERLFQAGMVVLDTNVLLNLYRSNARTRQDTLAVLSKLRDRLWVPHQVLTEFWRNREQKSIRHHHSTRAKETSLALDKARRSAHDAVDRWMKDVRLKQEERVTERIAEGLKALSEAMDGLRELIDEQARRDVLEGTEETHSDPVLTELEPLLQGRIGEPLPEDEYDRAVQTAQKRADEEIPPGFEDFKNKPPERAAGDYLLWVQLLKEAQSRKTDVLLVTGDVKKDWWHPRDGDVPARPRAELLVELREHADVRLFMLTPAELLTWAEELLDGLDVDMDSVGDLEQLREADRGDTAVETGWTRQSLGTFVEHLRVRYPAWAKVVIAAAMNGGFVDRATVYDLAGFPDDRQLKGFTRPISTVARELEDQGLLSGEESFLLHTIYGSATEPSWATGFRIPDEAVPLLVEIFGDGTGRSQPSRGESDPGDGANPQEA
ncbi:PIN-like domain-containing protein [Streptomyces solicathayae]|uniref:PIN-like domain-containing protein n=1 Tax=Streptomyces solicathayae TaxID=3081768 RepID=A0ABZ0LPM4_9ACTN|nr:PIN-like domain-containing protein [Streptomyces sp. HUAS YS2]WOX21225.1 PIN-like domain-containing protein [Streptomyces sp. HUAS YS2]